MDKMTNNTKRPPIVVVVGHVDHGKTTLLDYIRKANVAEKEAGGITQSVGAYEIEHNNEKITFIDTPGHEAFSKMRVRGTAIADIAILVVAADESVKPQTKEAIKVLQESKTPYIVAITKIDRPGADIEKVKNDLTIENVLLEGFGGSISYQTISGKTGEGIDELLDLVLLMAEVEELKYNPEANARGIVLESRKDNRRGNTVSLILKDGSLKSGAAISTESTNGKIKILENFLGERVKSLIPSNPAVVIGFETLPKTGEEFISGNLSKEDIDKLSSKSICEDSEEKECKSEDGKCIVKILLKADVAGSLEALSDLIYKVPKKEKYDLKIIYEKVGEITDGDIKTAIATKAIVLGFNVKPNKAAENLAKDNRVKIITSEIIYELAKAVEDYFKCLSSQDISGELDILAVFSKKAGKQTIGGMVIEGEIKNNANMEIQEGIKIIGKGKIINLQSGKEDMTSVEEGKECGLLVVSDVDIEPGYHLIIR
jgi:translation initiation factor IF-2